MISVQHLTKRFGRFLAVDDASFEVRRGEIFAFLGPNGSGKTTTMKSLVGLVKATSGKILVNGIDVHMHEKEAKASVSYLPQRVVFPENLTAREILFFYAKLRGVPTAKAEEALEKARFNGFSEKYIGEFSGGMVQRLGLAAISLPHTPILLLDEPTASLDPQGVKRFREFVLEQKEQGKTILFSTHLLAEAEQLADRVAIFVGGKLVAHESVEGLRQTILKNKTIEDMYLHYVETFHGEEH